MDFRETVTKSLECLRLRDQRASLVRDENFNKSGRRKTVFKTIVFMIFIWAAFNTVSENVAMYMETLGYDSSGLTEFKVDSSSIALCYFITIAVAIFSRIMYSSKEKARIKKAKAFNEPLHKEIRMLNAKFYELTQSFPTDHREEKALKRFAYYLDHGLASTHSECAKIYYQECENNRIVRASEEAANAAWHASMEAEEIGRKMNRAFIYDKLLK